MALETSVEVGVPREQSHAEGLDPEGGRCRSATASASHLILRHGG